MWKRSLPWSGVSILRGVRLRLNYSRFALIDADASQIFHLHEPGSQLKEAIAFEGVVEISVSCGEVGAETPGNLAGAPCLPAPM